MNIKMQNGRAYSVKIFGFLQISCLISFVNVNLIFHTDVYFVNLNIFQYT